MITRKSVRFVIFLDALLAVLLVATLVLGIHYLVAGDFLFGSRALTGIVFACYLILGGFYTLIELLVDAIILFIIRKRGY